MALHNYLREGGQKWNKSKHILTKALREVGTNHGNKSWTSLQKVGFTDFCLRPN